MSSRGARGKTVNDCRRAHSAHPGNERFWERKYESTRVPDLAGGVRCGRHLPPLLAPPGFAIAGVIFIILTSGEDGRFSTGLVQSARNDASIGVNCVSGVSIGFTCVPQSL